jgi:hypothetical protein
MDHLMRESHKSWEPPIRCSNQEICPGLAARQIDRQTGRQMDRQINRQTER